VAYGTIAYIIAYFLAPAVWRAGKDNNLLTNADFFENRYNSRALGVGVALLSFAMIVPYVTIQLSGLQILLRIAGYGAYNATAAVIVGFLVMALFVFSAGLRGTAWASVVKDLLVLGAVLFAGIAIPVHFFGSPLGLFERVLQTHPQMLTLPPAGVFHGTLWYASSVLLSALGFYVGPQTFNSVYSARSGDALRRNAIYLPIYQIVAALMVFAGLSAAFINPGLTGPNVDQSFMLVVQRYFPSWILGLVAGAGALAALVPASALLLAASSVITKNVFGDAFGVATSDRARTRLTRIIVVVVAVLALGIWMIAQKTVVELLLLYYNGITQFFPGVVAAFVWKRANAWGVGLGILAGVGIAVPLAALNILPFGMNGGFVGLLANVVVLIVVSLVTRHESG
jgi:SSS family solute:Na+ symporter